MPLRIMWGNASCFFFPFFFLLSFLLYTILFVSILFESFGQTWWKTSVGPKKQTPKKAVWSGPALFAIPSASETRSCSQWGKRSGIKDTCYLVIMYEIHFLISPWNKKKNEYFLVHCKFTPSSTHNICFMQNVKKHHLNIVNTSTPSLKTLYNHSSH